MAYSYVRYTGNGSTTNYTFSFPYIDQSHIKVRVNGVLTTLFTFLNSSALQMTTAPASGAIIEIRRETPKDVPIVDFTDGSVLLERDLDLLVRYDLYLAQETQDSLESSIQEDSLGVFQAKGKRIANVADPVAAQDAVTKNWAETAMTSQLAQATLKAAEAAASAVAADASADAADVSEAAALASKNAAATSETNAAASEDAAALAAVAAALSEDEAAAQASAANASQLAAATSATNALNSANAAAASFDSFDDRYLGAKNAAPATDNDGNALLTGATYWDTPSGQMFTWSGTSWRPTFLVGNTVRSVVTATAGQTVVATPTYLVGSNTLQVFVNGSKVLLTADYTETTQNSITFVSGLTLGDEVELIAQQAFAVDELRADLAASTAGKGSALVAFKQSGTGSVARTLDAKSKESVSVLDFGADPTGVTDSTAAIQAAIDYTVTKVEQIAASGLSADARAWRTVGVYFPPGHYRCSGVQIQPFSYLFADGGVILDGKDIDQHIFIPGVVLDTIDPGHKLTLEGFNVINARGLVKIDNQNQNVSTIQINRCEFKSGTGALYIAAQSSKVVVRDCVFDSCKYIVEHGVCDHATFENCWFNQGFLTADGQATFQLYGGEWNFIGNIGVPNHPSLKPGGGVSGLKDLAWVNANPGTRVVRFRDNRFSGERGGSALINWRTYMTKNAQTTGSYASALIVDSGIAQQSVRADYGDTTAINPLSIRLFSLPNIFDIQDLMGSNTSTYTVGVGSTVTSLTDLINNSTNVSDAETGFTGLDAIKWSFVRNTKRGGAAELHPLIAPYFRSVYDPVRTVLVQNANDYYSVYDTVNKKVTVSLKTSAFPETLGFYRVIFSYNPREAWDQRVFQEYFVNFDTNTTVTSYKVGVTNVRNLKSAAYANSGNMTADLKAAGVSLGTTTTTAPDEVALIIDVTAHASETISKYNFKIERLG